MWNNCFIKRWYRLPNDIDIIIKDNRYDTYNSYIYYKKIVNSNNEVVRTNSRDFEDNGDKVSAYCIHHRGLDIKIDVFYKHTAEMKGTMMEEFDNVLVSPIEDIFNYNKKDT